MSLSHYRQKRDFAKTPEPQGERHNTPGKRQFVVQKHAATRLHYDFRLELEGVLKSWAVPKGPSLDPAVRSLAVQVEDHPVEYGTFEGTIPAGQYGGGTVMLWDRGSWRAAGDASRAYREGKLRFELTGEKLRGEWTLTRMSGKASADGKNWLLIKRNDSFAEAAGTYDLLADQPNSVATGRALEQIAQAEDRHEMLAEAPGGTDFEGSSSGQLAKIAGAVKRRIPPFFPPQLPTLVDEIPSGSQWLHEIKLDGYRILVRKRNQHVRLLTRKGNDWSERFPRIATAISRLPLDNAMIDGEVVVLRRNGTTDFQALQNMLHSEREGNLLYFAFDLMYLNGYDLRQVSLLQRKQLLKQVIPAAHSLLRLSNHIEGQGGEILSHVCQAAAEGVVSKRAESAYHSGRSRSWIKVKCLHRQEFVIGGYTSPSGSRQYFGSLLLGYYDRQQHLIYCGKVGTGFTSESLAAVAEQLRGLRSKASPFDMPPTKGERTDAHWIVPQLIAEVQFSDWTADGRLRHASFQGLREDKEPHAVGKERPVANTSSKSKTGDGGNSSQVAGVTLSHAERVLYQDQGITKRDLAQYYEAVAEWMLPFIVGRPLSVVRCPQGQQAKCFFQKHVNESVPARVEGIEIQEGATVARYLSVDDLPGLVSLVQLGVLEIHPWGSRGDLPERPDQIVLDLDPAPEVSWDRVVSAAQAVREILHHLDLMSFVRTTGGKGLHVVVPITRRSTWDEVKQFSHEVAKCLVRQAPSEFIATSSKAKRRDKIFVDYLRNSRGATAIASYSTRARAGATVATPLAWEELSAELKPGEFHVGTVPARLRQARLSPWDEFADLKQSLTKSIQEKARRL